MSGIFGVIDAKQSSEPARILRAMAGRLAHRKWYVVETHSDESAGVGLGRIGIGVFNREPQPLYSEDEDVAILLSGEFYHTGELRRSLQAKGCRFRDASDLELALRLYQDRGEKFIRELEGVFVLAIWHRSRQKLIIANDRFGLYPLHYAHHNGRLIFAPEMKGILCDPAFRKELDLTALAEYTRFQSLLGDKTFFRGLNLLPNASLLSYQIDSDTLTIQPYWDFSEIPALPASLSFVDAVEEAGRLLKVAVDQLTEGDHRLGVYLSGGVDSRVILGLIPPDKTPVTSITYGLRECRDVDYAQQLAAQAHSRHHYFEFADGLWVKEQADFHLELTEGFHSWIHSHGMSVLEPVRQLIDVNLTGFGGGQSAVDWEDPAFLQTRNDLIFSNRLFYLLSQETTWPSISDIEEKSLYSPRLLPEMRDRAYDSFLAELARFNHLPHLQRAAYFALCNPDRRLFQYYTVFSRSHVEQRFPFYDYRYFEFVYALPPDMLFNRKLRRAIILKMMRPLARVPYNKDDLPITDYEPARITAKLLQKGKNYINRRLTRLFPERSTLYADYENWLRQELHSWGEAILLGEPTLQRDIFNPEFLAALWNHHQSGWETNTIGKLAPLMTWEMMARKYFDEPR